MRLVLIVASCVSALAPRAARASAAELFGLGSEQAALVGAVSASVRDFSAAYYNPAGLAALRGVEASVGVLGFGSRLAVAGQVQPIASPVGIVFGAAAPVPFGSFLRDRVYVGVALYVQPGSLVQVIAHPPEQPVFPYYDNRSQRLVVLPSLAVRIGWGLSAGVAFNYLAGLGGQVAASEGATRSIEARVDEGIFSILRVNAGLQWRSPTDRFAAALVYRQRFSVPFSTDSRNQAAGQPLDIRIDAEGLYTPDELVFGGSVRPVSWLRLGADLTASFWSAWRGPWVNVASSLPLVGSVSAPPPVLAYRDTVSLRLGAEATRALRPSLWLALRAGYGCETSAIPGEQPGVTNLLDGFKHFLGVGVGLRYARGAFALRVDAHGQLHVVQSDTLAKQLAPAGMEPDPAAALRDERPSQPGVQVSNPGYPAITGGGVVWSAGLTLTVER